MVPQLVPQLLTGTKKREHISPVLVSPFTGCQSSTEWSPRFCYLVLNLCMASHQVMSLIFKILTENQKFKGDRACHGSKTVEQLTLFHTGIYQCNCMIQEETELLTQLSVLSTRGKYLTDPTQASTTAPPPWLSGQNVHTTPMVQRQALPI